MSIQEAAVLFAALAIPIVIAYLLRGRASTRGRAVAFGVVIAVAAGVIASALIFVSRPPFVIQAPTSDVPAIRG
jgi:hypothetical protein